MTAETRAGRREAEAYAAAVARYLRRLPRAQRQRHVSDLRAHLLELPAGTSLEARLGSPRSYAAELIGSSGLSEPRGFAAWLRTVPLLLRLAVPLVLALAVTGTAGSVWVNGYDPLEAGSTAYEIGIQPDPSLGQQANILVDYQHDARYRFGFSIRNGGQAPVEIAGFSLADWTASPLLVERVTVAPPGDYGYEKATAFKPFLLPPGQERLFFFEGVLANCAFWEGGSSPTLQSINVAYSVLGVTKTRYIPLMRPIAIRMPGWDTAACPYARPPQQGPLNGNGTQVLSVLHGGSALDVRIIASRAPTGELSYANWPVSPACDDAPPSGFNTVPVDIVASRYPNPYDENSPIPIDLRFGLPGGSSSGRVLVGTSDPSRACRAANPVHIESLNSGDITVIAGMVEVPTGACGARQIEVSAREDSGWRPAGSVRLDIPCPAGS